MRPDHDPASLSPDEQLRELARLFPKGLADLAELPEEASGAVKSVWGDGRRAAQ